MVRVQHPTLPHVFNDVPDDQLGNWLAAGWLECPPVVEGQAPPARGRRRRGQASSDTPGE